ncbi:MAG: thioesterase [Eubacteriales bacterium]
MNKQLKERKQYLVEGGYIREEEITFGQCDQNLNVHMSNLLKQFVATSSLHCQAYELTYETLLVEDKAFIVTRMTLQIHRMPKCFDSLIITTYLDGIKGPYYQRVVQWEDEEGNILVSGRSDWVLVSPTKKTIYRPSKDDEFYRTVCPIEIKCGSCRKVEVRGIELAELGTHQVKWSELDGNGHVHSGNYGDYVWDYLPSELQEKVPTTFTLEFKKEVCLNDQIAILGSQKEDGSYVVVGQGEKGVHFIGGIQWN